MNEWIIPHKSDGNKGITLTGDLPTEGDSTEKCKWLGH